MRRSVEAALSENNFSSSIPSDVANLKQLRKFIASHTWRVFVSMFASDRILTFATCVCTELLSLSSDSSSLTGTLPSEIGLLPNLRKSLMREVNGLPIKHF